MANLLEFIKIYMEIIINCVIIYMHMYLISCIYFNNICMNARMRMHTCTYVHVILIIIILHDHELARYCNINININCNCAYICHMRKHAYDIYTYFNSSFY